MILFRWKEREIEKERGRERDEEKDPHMSFYYTVKDRSNFNLG